MGNKSIENSIFLSITLNIFIATALNFLIVNNHYFIKDKFIPLIAKYYSISIIFLILSFVFYQFIKSELTDTESKSVLKRILFNILFSVLLVMTILFPEGFGPFILFAVFISIIANILIPIYITISLILKTYGINF